MSLAIKEIVFSDGSQYFNALLQDINLATASIDLETYTFEQDSLGQRVIDHLAAASHRGVTVRVMLDGFGSALSSSNIAEQLEKSGVQVHIFRALPWNIKQWKWSFPELTWLIKFRRLLSVMNRRNHRKIGLIDRRVAWIGSFNICQCHLPKAEGGEGWRDTGVRLEGDNFDHLQYAFDRAWYDENSPISRKIFSIYHFRLNYIRRKKLRWDLLNRIASCQSRIWITNAYFMPDFSFLRRLEKASRRGVDVRILLPGRSDIFFIIWASAMFYQNLLRSGVRIFQYKESVLHAKIMILDDWITVGSSNLDYLSLFKNLEADVVLSLPASKNAIRDQFLEDINHSQEVTLNDLPHRQWWKKAFGRLAVYLKRWL